MRVHIASCSAHAAAALQFVTILLLPFIGEGQSSPTYYQDIQPILQKNCIPCHRVGEAAPFSLEKYEDVFKRADFIKTVTETKYMPPWFADPAFRHFQNERILSADEINLIAAWVDAGARKGKEPKPQPVATDVTSEFPVPDLVFKMDPPFTAPGDGTEQFRLFIIPTHTKEQYYVRGIDFRPGNLRMAHHARAMLDTTHVFRSDNGAQVRNDIMPTTNIGIELASYFWHGWVPGNFLNLYPEGMAKVLNKDSDILLNMHYSPVSRPETDQSSVLVYLAKEKPKREVKNFILDEGWIMNQPFVIPPNETITFYMRSPLVPADLSLISVLPHMHLLGKSFRSFAITPDGDVINLIKIDNWNFNWQMTYPYPQLVKLPKGSVVYAEAVYDNTTANPRNPFFPPRPTTTGWGTTDEMMNLIFEYVDYEPGDENLELFPKKK